MNKTLTEAIERYGTTRESLIPVMQYVVSCERWLGEREMEEIADVFNISPAEVYGTASFYSFLDIKPRGRFVIRVCRTISCDMAGKEAILDALKKSLRISVGQTTPDGQFTLLQTNCMGWCHKGPAMLVNDDVHIELTYERVIDIINSYRQKLNR